MKVRIEPVNDRMCIVTRARDKPDGLIRFVVGPDGSLVPDLRQVLPGRGCWVTAERSKVEEAVRKRLFARALKETVEVDPELGALIDRLMAESLLGMMNMARKSGQFIKGSTKADASIRSGEALAVFHAADAAADGIRKLRQAIVARARGMEEPEIPVFMPFAAQELDTALGEAAFIHAVALAGQAGEGVVKRAKILARYRDVPLVGT